MLNTIILEKICAPDDEDVLMALKEIKTIESLKLDEAQSLVEIISPYMLSENEKLVTPAKEAFNYLKQLHPTIVSSSKPNSFLSNLSGVKENREKEQKKASKESNVDNVSGKKKFLSDMIKIHFWKQHPKTIWISAFIVFVIFISFAFSWGKSMLQHELNENPVEIGASSYNSLNNKLNLVAPTAFSNPPDGQASESTEDRIKREWAERSAIVAGNPGVPLSDQYTGKTFKANGKEWRVGQYNISWTETQSWISNLGGGWRTPALEELKSLHGAVGGTSAIGWDWVWAERKDSSSAWCIYFRGIKSSHSIGYRCVNSRAVAVR